MSNTQVKPAQAPEKERMYKIGEAAGAMGIREQYLRKLIREGKVVTTKVFILNALQEPTHTFRHEIAQSQIDSYVSTKGTRVANRNDGRQRFVLYATVEEMVAIKTAYPAVEITKQKSNYNKEKSKAYHAKRDAAKKAALAAAATLAAGKLVVESN